MAASQNKKSSSVLIALFAGLAAVVLFGSGGKAGGEARDQAIFSGSYTYVLSFLTQEGRTHVMVLGEGRWVDFRPHMERILDMLKKRKQTGADKTAQVTLWFCEPGATELEDPQCTNALRKASFGWYGPLPPMEPTEEQPRPRP